MALRPTWFVFDLGNTLVRLAYRRVIGAIASESDFPVEEIGPALEEPGLYRDLERGLCSFQQFHEALQKRIGYHGSADRLRSVWSDFFDGPVEGMEDLLEEIRLRYSVGFLSNSNEVHAAVLPAMFPGMLGKGEPIVFSHELRIAKPEPGIFYEASRVMGAPLARMVYVDDLAENVEAASSVGMIAFLFRDAASLREDLRARGLL